MKGITLAALGTLASSKLTWQQVSQDIPKLERMSEKEREQSLHELEVGEPSCQMTNAYPPDASRAVPWYDVDLDLPPDQRWEEVINDYMPQVQALYELLYECQDEYSNEPCIFNRLIEFVGEEITGNEDEIIARWPKDYGQELVGIAAQSGVPLDQLIGLNMGYELMGFCTSIVAWNTATQQMYHGRNLDFGLMLGVNWTDAQWLMTDRLRDVTFNARMHKNGEVLYSGTWYASFIGLLTGVRENAMTITVDTRFDNNYDKYLLKWLHNQDDTDQFLTLTTRLAMETYDNFNDASKSILNTKMIGPSYIIIGGADAGEGAVITLGPNGTLADYWDIPEAYPADADSADKWYVLQTNYDHWNQPPWYDDRRIPGCDCMDEVGSTNLDIATLYNVLNGKPNRNRLTTYTSLMQCSKGYLEAWKQYCDDPDCSPW